jgi:hypothetical protein
MIVAILALLTLVPPQRASAVDEPHPTVETFTAIGALYEPDPELARRIQSARGIDRDRLEECWSPFSGLRIAVGVKTDEWIVEHVIETDPDGRFSVELPVPPTGSRRARSFVRVRADGYQQQVAYGKVAAADETVELRAPRIVPGATAFLRVLRGTVACPTGSIKVRAHEADPPRWVEKGGHRWSAPKLKPLIQPAVEPDRFALHYGESSRASLLVRRKGVGTAYLPDVRLGPDDAGRVLEVTLQGDGVLEGILHDPEGRPLPGIALTAYHSRFIKDAGPDKGVAVHGPELESRGGLCNGTAVTDKSGRFVIKGLLAGDYFLQHAHGASPRIELERRLYSTGSRAIRIEARRHRLVAEVVDANGAEVESPPFCVEHPEAVRRGWSPKRREIPIAPGTWAFDVEVGHSYIVGWVDETHQLVERVVTIESGRFETRCRLAPGGAEAPGEVTFRVLDEDDAPYKPVPLEELDLSVHSTETGKELWARDNDSALTRHGLATRYGEDKVESSTWLLPPGRYVVRANPRIMNMMCGNTTLPRLDYGPEEATFEVIGGESAQVEIRPWLGGRIRLRLLLPPDVRDQRLVQPPETTDEEDWGRRNDLFVTEEDNPCTRVFDIDDEGGQRALAFFFNNNPASRASRLLLPGTSVVSWSLLRPGTRRLRIVSPGFETEEVDVIVRARETVDVDVQLRER